MGKYDEAISLYNEIKSIAPEADEHLQPDFHIAQIKDIISGKIKPDKRMDNNSILAEERSKNGDSSFNSRLYENAISCYKSALGIKRDSIDNLFKILLCLNIYESAYYDESEKGLEALILCANTDSFKYLPFICTQYGDSRSYESWGQSKLAWEYYEIAVFLLDMVPVNERFAAPYYKLGRLKEQDKNYKEALKLYEKTKEIDFNYNVDDDIKRVNNVLQGNNKNDEEYLKQFNLIQQYQNKNLHKMVVDVGKKALKNSPNNIELLFTIASSAELASLLFEQKWALKEGLRLDLDEYDEKQLFYEFIISLGICCKKEQKFEQAKYYFSVILDNDEDYSEEFFKYKQRASSELDTCG